ncbi:MAG: DUF6062 family protein [Agathobacter sp.]|uniref:DUF6062 family protein n=1 Tax=Agathobacter sp. TaxID=2021311 RepID=UPI002584D51A|nr:DUF6062 family protein [Agathobacter sp.]MCR5677098.1 DUF6062 family protein [Agathobacter sp.]
MKEQLHTIPINDAMTNAGECPFCYMERKTEEHAMDFVLGHGASYMEADIREMTDKEGFCRSHFKKMYDYGNALGNAWILKTMYLRRMEEFEKTMKHFKPASGSTKGLFKKNKESSTDNAIIDWITHTEESCFICKMVDRTFDAYMKTFFAMYQKDADFRTLVGQTKGFCLSHFKTLLAYADIHLNEKQKQEFYDMILPLEQDNLKRVYEDIAWFIEKFDYQNKDADWKASKDAVQRGMQKLKGSDPSLAPHVIKK